MSNSLFSNRSDCCSADLAMTGRGRGRPPKNAGSAKADTKLAVKKGKTKAGKDPNKPKRAPSAFFVFLEEFRKEFKEKNPNNKSVAAVTKAGGARWKSMSDADKEPYVSKADKLKAEYQKKVEAYEKGQAQDEPEDNAEVNEEESDKSKSEVNSGSEEEDEDD
ncbi:DNA-binding protein MNB1B-like [Iris pallida]|uniref:DNA-binding protein MNB1B-like n=1 Tax=Iris pallida TaxID=29817 RepID=A0AAX6F1S3_IRIPA|nr:DNA-binding protein MNB1B-like [Iris pallida]